MTQEQKDLLLKDLCARLPYGVKIEYNGKIYSLSRPYPNFIHIINGEGEEMPSINKCKPYLRPMETMTEGERKGLTEKGIYIDDDFDICQDAYEGRNISLKYVVSEYTDWLNKKQFDYRGLIPMSLALPAPEGMYNV